MTIFEIIIATIVLILSGAGLWVIMILVQNKEEIWNEIISEEDD